MGRHRDCDVRSEREDEQRTGHGQRRLREEAQHLVRSARQQPRGDPSADDETDDHRDGVEQRQRLLRRSGLLPCGARLWRSFFGAHR